jgi:hypothetical protein
MSAYFGATTIWSVGICGAQSFVNCFLVSIATNPVQVRIAPAIVSTLKVRKMAPLLAQIHIRLCLYTTLCYGNNSVHTLVASGNISANFIRFAVSCRNFREDKH